MIKTTVAQKKEFIKEIQLNKNKIYEKEKIWNFLIADILTKPSSQKQFFPLFCDDSIPITSNYDIWYESQPISPRKFKRGRTETNTHLDIAFGSIKQRNIIGQKQPADSGIKYDPHNSDGWICFVEGKFKSELSKRTEYDPCKNQLTRVVENALCFQGDGCFPDKLNVVVLTPRVYKNDAEKNFVEKLKEYNDKPENILRDIESSKIQRRQSLEDWSYPVNIKDRIQHLRPLKHLSYEEIIEKTYNLSKVDLTCPSHEIITFFEKIFNDLSRRMEASI